MLKILRYVFGGTHSELINLGKSAVWIVLLRFRLFMVLGKFLIITRNMNETQRALELVKTLKRFHKLRPWGTCSKCTQNSWELASKLKRNALRDVIRSPEFDLTPKRSLLGQWLSEAPETEVSEACSVPPSGNPITPQE